MVREGVCGLSCYDLLVLYHKSIMAKLSSWKGSTKWREDESLEYSSPFSTVVYLGSTKWKINNGGESKLQLENVSFYSWIKCVGSSIGDKALVGFARSPMYKDFFTFFSLWMIFIKTNRGCRDEFQVYLFM